MLDTVPLCLSHCGFHFISTKEERSSKRDCPLSVLFCKFKNFCPSSGYFCEVPRPYAAFYLGRDCVNVCQEVVWVKGAREQWNMVARRANKVIESTLMCREEQVDNGKRN